MLVLVELLEKCLDFLKLFSKIVLKTFTSTSNKLKKYKIIDHPHQTPHYSFLYVEMMVL